jgi:putative zinc finger protein
MEQFPKIARARMAAQSPGDHPEAEQLNAFAERALTESERSAVIAHLAGCANCREIVHLAAEARTEGAPVAKPARHGFRWATFQWAAVAASVAIVTVAVLVVGPKETRAPLRATQSAGLPQQAAATPSVTASTSAANADEEVSRGASKPNIDANGKVARKKTGTGPYVDFGSVAGGGSGNKNAVGSDALAKMPEKKEAPPAEQAAKPDASRELAYSAPGSQDADTFTSSARRAPALNQPAQGTVQGQIAKGPLPVVGAIDGERRRMEIQTKTGNDVRKDKQPASEAVAESSSESVQATSQSAAPHATFSAHDLKKAESGKLKQQEANTASMYAAKLDASTRRLWRVQSGKVQSSDDAGSLWQDHGLAAGFQATKVAAMGQQVWVGGKSGALFLSRDGGLTFAKVSLTGDDIIPLGDVTDIKITSPQLANVLLDSGDDWQSNDGGKSFRLLPRKP